MKLKMKLHYMNQAIHHKNKFMGVKIFFSHYIRKVWSLKKSVLGKNNFFVHTKLLKAVTLFNIDNKESKIK